MVRFSKMEGETARWSSLCRNGRGCLGLWWDRRKVDSILVSHSRLAWLKLPAMMNKASEYSVSRLLLA